MHNALLRVIPPVMIALGLAGVSVALGLIYRDSVRQDLARERLALELHRPSDAIDDDARWDAWSLESWAGAMVAGTLGVASLGAGATLIVIEFLTRARARGEPDPR